MPKKKRTKVTFGSFPKTTPASDTKVSYAFDELLIVVDSNCLAYRELHSKRAGLKTDKERTGVVFGFLDTVLRIAEKFNTSRFAFAWDSKKSFRKLKYFPDYRKKREEARQNMTREEKAEMAIAYEQFDKLRKEVLPSLGFQNVFQQLGYEGDDIVASVVHHSDSKNMIVSNDHDLFQLLNEQTSIYNPSTKSIMTEPKFKLKKMITPDQWARVLAIGGCTTDGVPGVAGVGEMTAIEYINGTLPKSFQRYTSIEKNKKLIDNTMKLVELPLEGTEVFDIAEDIFTYGELQRVFKKYDFRSFLREPLWGKWFRTFCPDDIPF